MTDADLLARFPEVLAEAEASPTLRKDRGRRMSAKWQAYKALAEEAGTTADAVRKRLTRAGQPKPPTDFVVELWGMPVSAAVVTRVIATHSALTEAGTLVSRAMGMVTKLLGQGEEGVLNERRLRPIHEHLELCAKMLRDVRPTALCPTCKGLDGVQEGCGTCIGNGFATGPQVANADEDLKDKGDPIVLVAGERRRVHDLVDLPGERDPFAGLEEDPMFGGQ